MCIYIEQSLALFGLCHDLENYLKYAFFNCSFVFSHFSISRSNPKSTVDTRVGLLPRKLGPTDTSAQTCTMTTEVSSLTEELIRDRDVDPA